MDIGVADVVLTPVDHALGELATSIDHLIKIVADGGLEALSDPGLIRVMQTFEEARNRLPLVDHRMVADVERRDLANRLCQGSVRRVLTTALSISTPEASRRVKAAAVVGPRTSPLGQPLPVLRPHLAAAQQTGRVSTEKVAIIERAISRVDRPGFALDDIDAGERILTDHASQLPPEELKALADRLVDAIDPDGTRPQDELNTDRRHLELRPTRDGAWAGEFRLAGTAGVKLKTLLDPLAKVRVDTSGETDARTHGQRMHDALEEVCDRLLRSGDVPDTGGTPATVIVTIGYDDLVERTGYGRTADHAMIPTEVVLEMATEAEIIPAVLNSSGAVLDLGRTRRIASRSQTFALVARDGGCSFPGCSHPPQYCERHHIRAWIEGGTTDLNNLTLLCRYHHHNFATRGWTCRMTLDGLPEWTPPRWVDAQQKPMVNTRVETALTVRRRAYQSKEGQPRWVKLARLGRTRGRAGSLSMAQPLDPRPN